MRLILVRHGQTSSNLRHALDTESPGAELTPLGREQAAALPEALAGAGVEAVFASTLLRAQQTAEPVAAALGVATGVREGAREVRAGALEMRSDDDAVQAYLTTVFRWADGELDLRMPGGETGVEFFERYDAVVEEIAGTAVGCAVLVSHGAAIRCWTAARTPEVSAHDAARTALGNTGAIVLEGDPQRGWRATSWEGRALGGPAVADISDGAGGERAIPGF